MATFSTQKKIVSGQATGRLAHESRQPGLRPRLVLQHGAAGTQTKRPTTAKHNALKERLRIIRDEIDKWIAWDVFMNLCCWGVLGLIGLTIYLLN